MGQVLLKAISRLLKDWKMTGNNVALAALNANSILGDINRSIVST